MKLICKCCQGIPGRSIKIAYLHNSSTSKTSPPFGISVNNGLLINHCTFHLAILTVDTRYISSSLTVETHQEEDEFWEAEGELDEMECIWSLMFSIKWKGIIYSKRDGWLYRSLGLVGQMVILWDGGVSPRCEFFTPRDGDFSHHGRRDKLRCRISKSFSRNLIFANNL